MKQCPQIVRRICHTSMSTRAYSLGDVIFHFGESAESMIFVKTGLAKYTWGDENTQTLTKGEWISEAPLWTEWAHRGILYAVDDCVMILLNAAAFLHTVSQFEMADFTPGEYATNF